MNMSDVGIGVSCGGKDGARENYYVDVECRDDVSAWVVYVTLIFHMSDN